MSEERISVIFLRVLLSRKGTSLLTYAIDNTESERVKGMSVMNQWISSELPFKNISAELIGKRLDALYHYKRLYDGKAEFELTHLFDENGVNLLG